MKNAVANKIRLLKDIQPNPDWLKSQRSNLLLEISQADKQSRLSWRALSGFLFSQNAFKPIMVSALVLCLIFGGGFFMVKAAQNSLPGDLFYPVKIMAENIRIKASSQDTKPALQAEFVGARVDELTQIMDRIVDPGEKTEKVVKTVDKLQAQIVSTKVSLDKIKEAQPEKAAEVVGAITEKTTEAKERITEEFSAQGGPASGWKEEELKKVAKAVDAIDAALAAITGKDKSGIEVQMEVTNIEPKVEKFEEASESFEEISK